MNMPGQVTRRITRPFPPPPPPAAPRPPRPPSPGAYSIVGAVLLSLFLSGCFSTPATLDVGFQGSDAEYVQALAAADEWNTACGAYLIEVHRGTGAIDMRTQEGVGGDGAYGETTIQRPGPGGMWGPKRATSIWVSTAGGYAPSVMAHELGHALGLSHEDGGIMEPKKEWEQLDPAREYKSIRRGLISPDLCAKARAS